MTAESLKSVSKEELKHHIFKVLNEETYPCSVNVLRRKLKKCGLILPEYIITRSLRSLFSEGKAKFKAGKWISINTLEQIYGKNSGFYPQNIEIPKFASGFIPGEKVDFENNNYLENEKNLKSKFGDSPEVETERQSVQVVDRDINLTKGPWGKFRNIISYYSECLRNEEGADASAFIDQIGKKYLFARSIGNSYPKTGRSWSYVIPMGEYIADFIKLLSENDKDNIVIFGYPIEALCIKKDDGPDLRLITPIFQYVLKQSFSNNSITLNTLDAQPEISLQWMKYSLKSYSEKYHFLSHCGLINKQRPDDEQLGIKSDVFSPDLGELAARISSFMPKQVIEPLRLGNLNSFELPVDFKNGIYNKAVIMIGNRTKYTQTLLKELQFISAQTDEKLNQTSLKHIFNKSELNDDYNKTLNHEEIVADAIPMNEEQRASVASLLKNNISVVTGPPGTGKSQVVMGTVANIRLKGKSILFSSRNHKAIDAVMERLKDQNGNSIIKRTNSKDDPNLKYTFGQAIKDILSNSLDVNDIRNYEKKLEQLNNRLKKRGEYASSLKEIWSLTSDIGEFEENLAWLRYKVDDSIISKLDNNFSGIKSPKISNIKNLILKLDTYKTNYNHYKQLKYLIEWIGIFRLWSATRHILKELKIESVIKSRPPINLKNINNINLDLLREIKNYIEWSQNLIPLVDKLKKLEDINEVTIKLKKLSEDIFERTGDLITLHSQSHGGSVEIEDREKLSSLSTAIKIRNKSFEDQALHDEADKRLLEYLPLLLDQFPSWAVTNLSVGSRIPLAPGVFDLAVIDEASQSDIASAIPILFRAKRAAVVGDPNQLKFISKITVEKDSLLRKRAGLIELDDLNYSYRETSLYDLFENTSSVIPHQLKETHRSTLEIAEYSNNLFYNGILRVATNEQQLITPNGIKPGFHWTEVAGPVVSAGRSGCVSENEVEEIYKLVKSILVENVFKGTLGVVTPFRQQQKRLHDRIYDSDIPFDALTQSEFIADTINGFQGDEKDVMIFSLCAGEDMPRGSLTFLREDSQLFNVAVSRARAVIHIVGNRQWAIKCGIKHIEHLARPIKKRKSVTEKGPWSPHDSPWEKFFYEELMKKGIKTNPQYPASGRRLDLALLDKETGLKLDIEIDSDGFHRNPDGSRKMDDTWRDIYLMGLGWRVKRFWVYNLKDNIDKCVSEIEEIRRENG